MAKKKEEQPVNVYNDDEMRKAGFFRPYNQHHCDFRKTNKEKKALKNVKYKTPEIDGHLHLPVKPHTGIRVKIIVQLRKNKTFPHTTYSRIGNYNDIDTILNKYVSSKTGKCLVEKYKYNNRWYSVEERPYNPWQR